MTSHDIKFFVWTKNVRIKTLLSKNNLKINDLIWIQKKLISLTDSIYIDRSKVYWINLTKNRNWKIEKLEEDLLNNYVCMSGNWCLIKVYPIFTLRLYKNTLKRHCLEFLKKLFMIWSTFLFSFCIKISHFLALCYRVQRFSQCKEIIVPFNRCSGKQHAWRAYLYYFCYFE